MKNKQRFIKSSEIKQWVYCPMQWYLLKTKEREINKQAAKRGLEYHKRQAIGVKKVQKSQLQLITFIITGGLVCLFWFLSQSRW